MFQFHVGRMFAVNSDGSSNEFGTLQDITVNFKFDTKSLYGRNQDPVAIARGKRDISIKANFAQINAITFNGLLSGTLGTGMTKVIDPAPVLQVPSSTPYTVTITPPADATLGRLLAVYDVSNPAVAVPMKLVTSNPTTGQFTYSTGTLTFATADAGKNIQVLYDYVVTTGQTITLNNQPMGSAPTFQLEMFTALANKQITLVFNRCMSDSFDLNFKQEDFTIPSFSAKAYSDSADILGYLYIEE